MGHNHLGAKSCLQRTCARRRFCTYTASALTMMGWLRVGSKVRCHNGVVDIRVGVFAHQQHKRGRLEIRLRTAQFAREHLTRLDALAGR